MDATWYVDGSLLDKQWDFARRAGFSVVLVAASGELLACGFGVPPRWIESSGGAEVWAVHVVLRLAITPPSIVTDYLSNSRAPFVT